MQKIIAFFLSILLILVNDVQFANGAIRPDSGGELTLILPAAGVATDPRTALLWQDSIISTLMHATLTRCEQRGEISPGLLCSWEHNQDWTVWNFVLRGDLSFTDGTRVTSEDVCQSLIRLYPENGSIAHPSSFDYLSGRETFTREQETASRGQGLPDGMICSDDRRFTLTFHRPVPNLAYELSLPEYSILKPGVGDSEAPIGCGNFALRENSTNGAIVVSRRNARSDEPYLDVVRIVGYGAVGRTIPPDVGQSHQCIIRGPGEGFPVSMRRNDTRELISEAMTTVILQVNGSDPVLADPDVRHALSMSIDRDGITSILLKGEGIAARSLVPPALAAYTFLLDTLSFDTAGARTIFQSHWSQSTPRRLTLLVEEGFPFMRRLAERLQVQLMTCGLSLSLDYAKSRTFRTRLAEKRYQLCLRLFQPRSMEPYLSLLSSSHDFARSMPTELIPAIQPITNVLEQAGATPLRSAENLNLCFQAERLLRESWLFIPIVHPRLTGAIPHSICGVRFSPIGLIDLHGAWIMPDLADAPQSGSGQP